MSHARATPSLALRALLVGACLWVAWACGESIVQIDVDDVAEIRVSADSTAVVVGRTVDVDALALDAEGTLLLVLDEVTWSSSNTAVATVDGDGLVTGVSAGTANVIAQLLGLRDTTVVTVTVPPALALSADSVGFAATAGGSSPAPDSVTVTNAGAATLVASVDSVVYVTGAGGWLTAQLDGAVAPANLVLTPNAAGITTAGTRRALVWLSGVDADDSPAAVIVTLRIDASNAATITINDGDGQSRTVGTAVAVAPSVLVRDAFSNPVVGATVTFAVTGGGGQITGAAAIVGATGIARVGSWTLGTTVGANQLTATIGLLAPVVFNATGTVGAATQVVVTGGNNQSALAGSALGVAPTVSVRDQHGNGVSGVAVTFAVASGGGSVTGASQTSGAGGLATVGSWTLGTVAGANTLTATATGVGTPAVISATGLTGAADSIFATAGNAQQDTVAGTLATPYSVRVVDSNGNGVAGIPIAWNVTTGGGSITPLDTTDATGHATAVRVLGTVPGTNTATAVLGGVGGSPVVFGATATVGSPHAVTITAGLAQSDTVDQIVPVAPQVRVADRFDNPVQNHPVTFTASGNGAVVPTTPVNTLVNGTATVTSWRLGTTAGASRDTLTATASGGGLIGNPARIVATSVAGSPTTFTILAGNAQTAVSGVNVATAPVVVLRDAFNNGVSGRTVTFTTTGGTRGTPSMSTTATGQATTTWAPNVSGGTLQANGSFPDTLFAATAGFTTLQVTGSAIYSWTTHVNPLINCGGCHDFGGGSGGLNFDGTATQDRQVLYDVAPTCNPGSTAYRRVSPVGGVAASDTFSVIIRKLDNTIPGIGACGAHGGGEVAPGTQLLETLRAWIRNGAPNN